MDNWIHTYKGVSVDRYTQNIYSTNKIYTYLIHHTPAFIHDYALYCNHELEFERRVNMEYTDTNVRQILDNLSNDLIIVGI